MDAILRDFRSLECQFCNRHFGYELRADGGKTKICGSQCAETFLRRSRSMPRLHQAGMNLSYPTYPPPPSPHLGHAGLMVPLPYAHLNWNMAAAALPPSYQQTPQQSAFCISPGYTADFMPPVPSKALSRPRSPSPVVCTPSDGEDNSRRDKRQPYRRGPDAAKKPRSTDDVDSKKDAKLALTLKEQIKEAMMNDPSIVKIAPLAAAAMIEKSGNENQEEVDKKRNESSGVTPDGPGTGVGPDDSAQPVVSEETSTQDSTNRSDTRISKYDGAAADKVDVEESPLPTVFLKKPNATTTTKYDLSPPAEENNESDLDSDGCNTLEVPSATKTSETDGIAKNSNQIDPKPMSSQKSEGKSFYDKFETTSYTRKKVRSLLNFGDDIQLANEVDDDWTPGGSLEISTESSSSVEPVETTNEQAVKTKKAQDLHLEDDEWDDEGPQNQKEETKLPQSMSMLKIITEANTAAEDECDSERTGALSSYKPLYQSQLNTGANPLAKQVLPKENWLIQDLELSPAFRQNTGALVSWLWDNADFNLHAEADANNLQKLVDEISEYCEQAIPMERIPAVGEIVLAPYHGDFYRAVVVSCKENFIIAVEFVDYGDTKEVAVAECFEVTDDIMKKHPVYGLRFSQAFDKPLNNNDLSVEVVEYIKDKNYKILMNPDSSNHDEFHWHGDLQLVSGDKIVMAISDLFEDPSKLRNLGGKQEARQINKTLAQLAPKSTKTSPQLSSTSSTNAPLPKTKPTSAPVKAHPLMTNAPSLTKATVKASIVQSQREPMPNKPQDRTESWVNETSNYPSPGAVTPRPDCAIKTESAATPKISNTNVKTAEGKTFNSMELSTSFKQGSRVQISFVWNPARLTVNAIADADAMLDLEMEITKWVVKAPGLKMFPKKGEVVLAPYDGVYYRGVATTDASLKLGEAEMKFIDYGDLKKVPIKDLRPMSEEIASHPVYGLELDMDGIGNVTMNIWNYPQLSKAVRNGYENMTVKRLEEIDPYRWRAELWFDEYDDWAFVVATAISTLVK